MNRRMFIAGLGGSAAIRPPAKAHKPRARTFHALLLALLATLAFPAGQVAPAFAQSFLTFHCADGTEFVTVFREGTRSAYVQLDGKAMTLARRLSISGARYSAGRITLRIRQNTATLARGRQSTACSSS